MKLKTSKEKHMIMCVIHMIPYDYKIINIFTLFWNFIFKEIKIFLEKINKFHVFKILDPHHSDSNIILNKKIKKLIYYFF